MKNTVTPPQAGAPIWPNTDRDMKRLSAAALPLYKALKALRDETYAIAIRHGYGYEGSNLLEVMSDAREALHLADGGELPPQLGENRTLPPDGGQTK